MVLVQANGHSVVYNCPLQHFYYNNNNVDANMRTVSRTKIIASLYSSINPNSTVFALFNEETRALSKGLNEMCNLFFKF